MFEKQIHPIVRHLQQAQSILETVFLVYLYRWFSTDFVFATQSTHIGEPEKEKERKSTRKK